MMECWEHFAFTLAICLGNYIGTYMTCLVFGEEEELALQKEVTPNWIVRDWNSNYSTLHRVTAPSHHVKYVSLSSLIEELT